MYLSLKRRIAVIATAAVAPGTPNGHSGEDTDEAVHLVQSEAVQAFRFQAVHGSEVKSST
jgi:hypothetical protein